MDLRQPQEDPMYIKACEMACKLLDASERFINAVNHLQQSIDQKTVDQDTIYSPLRQAIDQYEQLQMINNVLKAIYPSIQNIQRQQSLESATVSATNTSTHHLLRIHQLITTHSPNASDMVKQELVYVSRQLQQTVEVTKSEQMDQVHWQDPIQRASPLSRNVSPMQQGSPIQKLQHVSIPLRYEQPQVPAVQMNSLTTQASPTQPLPIQLTTHGQPSVIVVTQPAPVSIPDAFMPVQSDPVPIPNVPATVEPKASVTSPPPPVSTTSSPPSQASEVFLTSQFLEQFEATATQFASLNSIHINAVWESMLVHALPSDQIEWAKQHLLNKDYTWEKAKQIFKRQFPDASRSISPVARVKQKPQEETMPLSMDHEFTLPKSDNTRRMAVYAEHLLGLEMKLYDNIDEYNNRYSRYCRIAQMDLHDPSLMQRYVRSLKSCKLLPLVSRHMNSKQILKRH
ncbi:uncharacterized protein B0P05DRAFT_533252 [Gilbertella persicaria]|uniref:uncharacterized protein n=1 Tax=Gilbertella persicaria TaxID=101096 RepID=UPI00221F06F1|nr:uncharacterized protein B0P05DRAFT_533252 [Gilbertella persicaria]KAI8086997.1 hypothetical protein B0P05DRAFT_533252 [Gilbertella persicaria]